MAAAIVPAAQSAQTERPVALANLPWAHSSHAATLELAENLPLAQPERQSTGQCVKHRETEVTGDQYGEHLSERTGERGMGRPAVPAKRRGTFRAGLPSGEGGARRPH